jgi:hypothetical protein
MPMSGTSLHDGDANAFALHLFGSGEDSHRYDVPAAVHRLDVGSVFTVQFVSIPGQPIISYKVPAGATPSSIFHVNGWSMV